MRPTSLHDLRPAPAAQLDRILLVMGTGVRYDLRHVTDTHAAEAALDAADAWLRHVDEVFSTYRSDSAVTRLREDRPVDPAHLPLVDAVLSACEQAWSATRGWYDPWEVPGGFDPSGYVKGWALSQVGELLAPVAGAWQVNAGGDLLLSADPQHHEPWRIGVRHPELTEQVAAVLSLTSGAVATSGTYARGEHVLDPFRHEPARGMLSATVVGPDPGMADAYATALFAAGLDGLDWFVDLAGYEAFLIDAQRRTWSTPGLPLAA